jgi:hypothetical protein
MREGVAAERAGRSHRWHVPWRQWCDPLVPAVALAVAALVFAALRWNIATSLAIGAVAGYSLSGSV